MNIHMDGCTNTEATQSDNYVSLTASGLDKDSLYRNACFLRSYNELTKSSLFWTALG